MTYKAIYKAKKVDDDEWVEGILYINNRKIISDNFQPEKYKINNDLVNMYTIQFVRMDKDYDNIELSNEDIDILKNVIPPIDELLKSKKNVKKIVSDLGEKIKKDDVPQYLKNEYERIRDFLIKKYKIKQKEGKI